MSERNFRSSFKPSYKYAKIEEIDESQDYSRDIALNSRSKTEQDFEQERFDIIKTSNEIRRKRSTSKN
jgi:hypothetical protein